MSQVDQQTSMMVSHTVSLYKLYGHTVHTTTLGIAVKQYLVELLVIPDSKRLRIVQVMRHFPLRNNVPSRPADQHYVSHTVSPSSL
jgi:hypothetical protein